MQPSSFRPHHSNRFNFDPYSNSKSTSIPRQKNRVNFDPDTKNKSFLTATLKPSQFRSQHWNQVIYYLVLKLELIIYFPSTGTRNRPHSNEINFIPSLKIKSSSIPHTEIKSISTTYTKTKSISMLTLKPSYFQPAYKDKSISTTQIKTKSIDHHTNNNSFSARTQKASQFIFLSIH